MHVKAKDLEFVNIGQTIEFKPSQSEDPDAPLYVTGRLESIELNPHGYMLVIGGEGYPMQGGDSVEMYRSVEGHHIKLLADEVARLAQEVRDEL